MESDFHNDYDFLVLRLLDGAAQESQFAAQVYGSFHIWLGCVTILATCREPWRGASFPDSGRGRRAHGDCVFTKVWQVQVETLVSDVEPGDVREEHGTHIEE
ncbi:MAG: hypothetical protein ALECFALPRED_007506 [Alectoria fallacina]|uniref:Uncharacterized protein n=1 Tax=Alectoria fallacina TaxID=1903189 RepID=A0A8H3EFL1_9LECA|nr:MAG: hypothetical protein ALECFALPRED_007506 [Alectoria fallacina]